MSRGTCQLNSNVFGTCRRCGGVPVGGYEALTGADAADSEETQQEQKLVFFRYEWVCPQCRQDIINDEQSEVKSEFAQDGERFRAAIGFSDEIT